MVPIYHAARVAPDSGAALRYHGAMRFLVVLMMVSLLIAAVFAADSYAARQLLRADYHGGGHSLFLQQAGRRRGALQAERFFPIPNISSIASLSILE